MSSQFMQIKRESLASEDMPNLIPFPNRRVAIITRKTLIPETDGPSRRVRVACCRRLVSDFAADGRPICPFHGVEAPSKDFIFTRSVALYLLGLVFLAFITSSALLSFRASPSPPVAHHTPVFKEVELVRVPQPAPSESEISGLRAERDRLVRVEEHLREEISTLRDSLRELVAFHQASSVAVAPVEVASEEATAEEPDIGLTAMAGFAVGLLLLRGFLGVFAKTKNTEKLELEKIELLKQVEETRTMLEELKAALEQKHAEEVDEMAVEEKEAEGEPQQGQWCRAEVGELSPLRIEEAESSSLVMPGQSEKENMQPSEIGYEDSGLFGEDGENVIEYIDEELEPFDRVNLREAQAMRKHILRTQHGRFSDSSNFGPLSSRRRRLA